MIHTKKTYLLIFFSSLFLLGCSVTKPIYYSDGGAATVASCTNSSWLDCYEVAGEKCKSSGYEVLEKMTSRSIGFWSSNEIKQMIFICKPQNQNNIN